MSNLYQFSGDYKQQFADHVTLLTYLATKSKTSYVERLDKVRGITNEYLSQVEGRPDYRQLDRLSSLILYDDLRDSDPHKVSRNKYPILSERQLDRRRFGERGSNTNMHGETSLAAAECVAVDGRDYRLPNRRPRSIDELIYVDEHAAIHNKARREQYALDIAPGKMVVYNLRKTGGEFLPSFVQSTKISYNCVPEYYR